ncbi:hypothetical protein KY290_012092 [Solanum tuberosum]|uniref:RING-type domain-containing protein n=1 Tax=Solanum tuberosum TaxID=4113 RepID=A0ABQ7W2K6_SOLTU|nr:hypothetical protein KY289_010357 [Solanum tuberosum]KAH0710753.1 hypothetical protein KY284_012180 [Solanum tuberosum]KAH0774955.1 hypothetical protein KY290_012092 [Solanum tuberosum]
MLALTNVATGVAVIITCFILKSLGACHDESNAVTESDPISQHREVKSIYGTYEEEANCGRSSSSEDLYDGRICVICYDNSRNCFFVPCGHCATCQVCAQSINLCCLDSPKMMSHLCWIPKLLELGCKCPIQVTDLEVGFSAF